MCWEKLFIFIRGKFPGREIFKREGSLIPLQVTLLCGIENLQLIGNGGAHWKFVCEFLVGKFKLGADDGVGESYSDLVVNSVEQRGTSKNKLFVSLNDAIIKFSPQACKNIALSRNVIYYVFFSPSFCLHVARKNKIPPLKIQHGAVSKVLTLQPPEKKSSAAEFGPVVSFCMPYF